jgi:hypothetical protein
VHFAFIFLAPSPTAIADNAAFDLTSGDRATYMGYVDFPARKILAAVFTRRLITPAG